MSDETNRPGTAAGGVSGGAIGRAGMFVRPSHPLFVLLFCLAASVCYLSAAAQTGPGPALESAVGSPTASKSDPIAVVAHGGIFDTNMKQIDPTPEFLRHTLDLYIKRLTGEANDKVRATLDKHRKVLVEKFGMDEMTPRFLILDYLTSAVAPRDQAYLDARNHALRRAWYKGLLGLERYRKEVDRRTKLPHLVTKFGQESGMVTMATDAAGPEYIKECKQAEVPEPPQWGGGEWTHVGNLTTRFLNIGNPIQVWRADSKPSDPKGLCVALPRVEGSNISALGIICLGTESSNACFYDASDVPMGKKLNAKDFLSGNDLFNGVCTDCHAGENPYVVHPEGPLRMWPDNQPKAWHKPLIKPSWPQNPGPFELLAQVPINPLPPDEDLSCLSCHRQGGPGGRFPDVLALNAWAGGISAYCSMILNGAVNNTMPTESEPAIRPPDPVTGVTPKTVYDKHAQAMLAFCTQSTPPGSEVPPPDTKDDPNVVSPPLVIGPLYACATAVEVRGSIYGATLTVSVNDTPTPAVTVTTPSQTIVPVPGLVAGDVVTAVQDVSGVLSDPSNAVKVIDHTVNYPNGLPMPVIDPKVIYQCGQTIAVRHVRGAKVTVFTNGTDDVTKAPGGDWTNLKPKIRPFVLNDAYTAQQSLCTDTSPISAAETAGTPPSLMPVPAIDPPPPILQGQPVVDVSNLANGALTTLSESSAGELAVFSTAVDRQSEVDVATGLGGPVQAGHQLSVVSKLCEDVKVSFPEVKPCTQLDTPRIATPFVGQTFVTVTDAVPGARILVYDAALNEIGDGSGVQVGLTRPIVLGDILTVIQKLGDCTSAKAYKTGVVCASTKKNCG